MDDIPGIDRGALVAALAGAVAYLCTQDRMPVARAVASVVAGTVAAVYIAPGIIEYLGTFHNVVLGERARYALIFITGVGGIWLLNLIVALLQAARDRAGEFVGGLMERVFGKRGGGNGGDQ